MQNLSLEPHTIFSFPSGRNRMITNHEVVTKRGKLVFLPLSLQEGGFLAQRQ